MMPTARGVATGGVYRDIYPPNQDTLNFLCGYFVSLTQDKFDIVQFIPPPNQIPGYASADCCSVLTAAFISSSSDRTAPINVE